MAQDPDLLHLKMFFKSADAEITDDEVEYFRDHPDQIEEVTAPVNIHKFYLWAGALIGTLIVGISKALSYSGVLDYLHKGVREFVVDIVFEIGVALIGASATAYILGILLNKQQQNAAKWRAEIRNRIGDLDD